MLKFLLKFFLMLIFPKRSRYLHHIWYGPTLEHWLLLYMKKNMSLGLAPGWDQRSVSRMMLMLKFFSNSFKTSLRYLVGIW